MPEFELGDDGEFAEAVDTNYGVYSARRKMNRLPMVFAFSGLFACAIFLMLAYAGFSS